MNKPDTSLSSNPLSKLIKKVNARIPSNVTPSTRIEIHPSEWLMLADAVATHEPKNALDDKTLCDALREVLRHAFVPGMQTADGSPFQFVDLMSDPGTDISTGIDRIESFAENVTDAVMELLPQDSIVTDIKLRSIEEAERIYRAVQPPSALRPGLERAIEVISKGPTWSEYYDKYRDRLIELLDEEVGASETKGVGL
jgi:hypothetical protein